jgi:hypothetical protein
MHASSPLRTSGNQQQQQQQRSDGNGGNADSSTKSINIATDNKQGYIITLKFWYD